MSRGRTPVPPFVVRGNTLTLYAGDRTLGWITAWPFPTGDVGIVLTHRTLAEPVEAGGTWATQVWGGPLHGAGDVGLDGALTHAKWAWRVAHLEQTRPEWFGKGPRRRLRPRPQ